MHHTLRISEVLSHIFDYALLTPNDGRLRALRSLALTCKAFEDPALTILWRNMVSLVPLVKCLPEELWEIEIDNNGNSILYTKGSPNASDVRRLQKYARLIRHLHLGSEDTSSRVRLDAGVLKALPFQTGQILPSLLTLALTESDDQELESLHLLIGEKLTTFVLEFAAERCDEEAGGELLRALGNISKSLEDLEISAGPQTSSSLSIALSNAVCNLSHIHRYSSPCISLGSDAFAHLSSMPDLRVLEVAPLTGGFESPLPPFPFPALRELTIWTKRLPKSTEMMGYLHPIHLETLIIHAEETPSSFDVAEFFTNLRQHCSWTSLKRFYGFQDEFQDDSTDDNVQTLDSLRPLLSFHNLEYVWMNGCMSFENANDAFVREMAEAWPRLRELDFGSTSCWGLPSRVTLDGLLAFCECCPGLRVLGVTFDASSDVSPLSSRDEWATPPRSTRMKSLQVGHSRIRVDQVGAVAAFLQQVFPELSELTCWEEHDGPGWSATRSAWLRVASLAVSNTEFDDEE
ncbi:hypothetical protein HWV62_2930 [Athelia sp. TMB]|nr:hypothetical protein HWV62_2930 [Athelia sp. TMB]